jgi:hypothetical protein
MLAEVGKMEVEEGVMQADGTAGFAPSGICRRNVLDLDF